MDAFFKKAKPQRNVDVDMEANQDNTLMAQATAKPKYVPWIEK